MMHLRIYIYNVTWGGDRLSDDFDIAKLMQMMEMAKQLSNQTSQTENSMNTEAISPPRIKALAAALPHMPLKNQRNLAIGIKMMEIQEINRYYNTIEAQSEPDPHWRRKALAAILPHLNEKKQGTLRSIVQIMEMQEIIKNIEQIKELSN